MGTLFFILGLILIVVSAIVVYKTTEVHELYKMRAAFEDKRKNIKKLIEDHQNDLNFNNDYYQGCLEELDEVEVGIDENIHLLKYFDFGNSN